MIARLRRRIAAARHAGHERRIALVLAAVVSEFGWTSAHEVERATNGRFRRRVIDRALAELEARGHVESRMESARIIRGRSPRRIWWATGEGRRVAAARVNREAATIRNFSGFSVRGRG